MVRVRAISNPSLPNPVAAEGKRGSILIHLPASAPTIFIYQNPNPIFSLPMTLSDILANEELRQHEFPVTRKKIFLAHAAVCPLPRRVAEAISQAALYWRRDDQERSLVPGIFQTTRGLAAQLLNAQPEEIALVGPPRSR